MNFPTYSFRFKNSENNVAIFDEIRKKFILLTPEEWVRQHTLHYLIQDKNYPKSHINVEKLIKINTLNKRYDIVVFQPNGEIFLLIECKAKYLMLTNGINHYFCQMDFENEKYIFLKELPKYK